MTADSSGVHSSWSGPDVRIRLAQLSRRLTFAAVAMIILSGVAGCAPTVRPGAISDPIVVPLPQITADVWAGRGQVIRQEPYADPPFDDPESNVGEAWRASYGSVSGMDGRATEVSGVFFLPRGNPPAGGWPVVSLAHGTTGIGHDCGPSLQPNLMGYASSIESLLAAGYAVAATDYEGLGETGSHPYLEARTAAFNTIDAVRAIRNLSPATAARWVGVGYSQGGQAVWAANELNAFYGIDLQFKGSVALAPAANVTAVADLARSGAMTDEQRALYPLLILGVTRYNHDLDARSFLHGSLEASERRLSRCEPAATETAETSTVPAPWSEAVDRIRESNALKPDTARDVTALADALRETALPQRRLNKPMLVIAGGRDALVLPQWVQYAVTQSCSLGGHIEYLEMPDVTHREMMWKAAPAVESWIADRFSGAVAPSNCPVDHSVP
ncbi:MAG: alpha/beta fold hydrolase [Mycobacterium sp.]